MFQCDWRNTPNSRRNQYMADRWFSIEQRSPKKRGKLAWFSQPMISFFGVTWLRWQIFKEKALLQHFPFYTTCSWAIFLRTRHLARNAIFFFHFLSVKCQLLNHDQSSKFLFFLTSLIITFDRSVLSVPFIRSTLSFYRNATIMTPYNKEILQPSSF